MDKQHQNRAIASFLVGIVAVALIALVFFADREFDLHLSRFGVFPREWHGLKGILFYPLIHGSLEHLFNNSVPLLVLLSCLYFFYPNVATRTVVFIYLFSGIWIWISARQNYHIGASGVVYGLAAFLFFSGIFRRDNRMIAISMMVAFLYGSMVWGILPIQERVSWEGHLWGAFAGIALAFYYRKQGPKRKLYQWEIDEMLERQRAEELKTLQEHPNVVVHSTDTNRRISYIYVPRPPQNKEGKEK